MPARHSFLSVNARLDVVFDVAIVLILSATWLGLLGRFHWTLDLFSHFRWQYLGICLIAVLWTLFRRRRVVLMVALASLGLNGWLIGQLALGEKVGPPAGSTLRVVSLNVLTSNLNKTGVVDYLRQVNPDVIFFMEVDAAWAQALKVFKTDYPHALMRSQQDNFGSALFSRVPLKDLQLFQPGAAGMPSIHARLIYNGRELMILGTHPLPPIGARMAGSRNAQLTHVAEIVKNAEVPVLVIGDLNSTPWSYGMRLITAGNKLGFRSPAPAWTPTWQAGTVFAIPIDHALCTPPLVIASREIGPDVGSDHRPQELEIGWAAD